MNLIIIDLDGTLTKSDNLVRFSLFMVLREKKIRFLLFFPLILALKLKLINNKEFKFWYSKIILKNQNLNDLAKYALNFVSSESFQKDINQDVIKFIQKYDSPVKIIISANFAFLTEPIAKKLSIETCLAINLETKNKQYTGKILGQIPYGEAKIDVYKDFTKHTLNTKTIGFGDSISDVPLLEFFDEGYIVRYDKKTQNTIFTIVVKKCEHK